jgi:hypothetical protein
MFAGAAVKLVKKGLASGEKAEDFLADDVAEDTGGRDGGIGDGRRKTINNRSFP